MLVLTLGLTSGQPDIKALQINLTGFLDKDTPKFCKELWSLCLSGQENPQGVPKELLEAKKQELMQEKVKHTNGNLIALVQAVADPYIHSLRLNALPKLLDVSGKRSAFASASSMT